MAFTSNQRLKTPIIFMLMILHSNCMKKKLAQMMYTTLVPQAVQAPRQMPLQAMAIATQNKMAANENLFHNAGYEGMNMYEMANLHRLGQIEDLQTLHTQNQPARTSGIQQTETFNQPPATQRVTPNPSLFTDTSRNTIREHGNIPFYYPLTVNKETILPIPNRVTWVQEEGSDHGSTGEYYAAMRRQMGLPEHASNNLGVLNPDLEMKEALNILSGDFSLKNVDKIEVAMNEIKQPQRDLQAASGHNSQTGVIKRKKEAVDLVVKDRINKSIAHRDENTSLTAEDNSIKDLQLIANEPKALDKVSAQPSNLMEIQNQETRLANINREEQTSLQKVSKMPSDLIQLGTQDTSLLVRPLENTQLQLQGNQNKSIQKGHPESKQLDDMRFQGGKSLQAMASEQKGLSVVNDQKNLATINAEDTSLTVGVEQPSELMAKIKENSSIQRRGREFKQIEDPRKYSKANIQKVNKGQQSISVINEEPNQLSVVGQENTSLTTGLNEPTEVMAKGNEQRSVQNIQAEFKGLEDVSRFGTKSIQGQQQEPTAIDNIRMQTSSLTRINASPKSLQSRGREFKQIEDPRKYSNKSIQHKRKEQQSVSVINEKPNQLSAVGQENTSLTTGLNEPTEVMAKGNEQRSVQNIQAEFKGLEDVSRFGTKSLQEKVQEQISIDNIKGQTTSVAQIDPSQKSIQTKERKFKPVQEPIWNTRKSLAKVQQESKSLIGGFDEKSKLQAAHDTQSDIKSGERVFAKITSNNYSKQKSLQNQMADEHKSLQQLEEREARVSQLDQGEATIQSQKRTFKPIEDNGYRRQNHSPRKTNRQTPSTNYMKDQSSLPLESGTIKLQEQTRGRKFNLVEDPRLKDRVSSPVTGKEKSPLLSMQNISAEQSEVTGSLQKDVPTKEYKFSPVNQPEYFRNQRFTRQGDDKAKLQTKEQNLGETQLQSNNFPPGSFPYPTYLEMLSLTDPFFRNLPATKSVLAKYANKQPNEIKIDQTVTSSPARKSNIIQQGQPLQRKNLEKNIRASQIIKSSIKPSLLANNSPTISMLNPLKPRKFHEHYDPELVPRSIKKALDQGIDVVSILSRDYVPIQNENTSAELTDQFTHLTQTKELKANLPMVRPKENTGLTVFSKPQAPILRDGQTTLTVRKTELPAVINERQTTPNMMPRGQNMPYVPRLSRFSMFDPRNPMFSLINSNPLFSYRFMEMNRASAERRRSKDRAPETGLMVPKAKPSGKSSYSSSANFDYQDFLLKHGRVVQKMLDNPSSNIIDEEEDLLPKPTIQPGHYDGMTNTFASGKQYFDKVFEGSQEDQHKGELFYNPAEDKATLEGIASVYDEANIPMSTAEKVMTEEEIQKESSGENYDGSDDPEKDKFYMHYLAHIAPKLQAAFQPDTSVVEKLKVVNQIDPKLMKMLDLKYKMEPQKEDMHRQTMMDLPYYNLVLNIEEKCIEMLPLEDCSKASFALFGLYKKFSWIDKRNYAIIKSSIIVTLQETCPKLLKELTETDYNQHFEADLGRSQHMYNALEFLLYSYVSA